MEKNKNSEHLPRLFGDKCFFCGDNSLGLRMKFIPLKDSVISILEIPKHLCGWEKFAHGGVISSVLDEVMSWAALYSLRKIVMTKKLTVKFLKPVTLESPLKAEGKIIKIKSKKEVLMKGTLYDDKEEKILAEAEAVFAVFSPGVGKKLGVMDEIGPDPFEKFRSYDAVLAERALKTAEP